jgi:hypothetical protein
MSFADRVLADYQQAMAVSGEDIAMRRFSGTPQSRTHADTTVRAKVAGYEPTELIGSIVQGDRKVICLVDTLSGLLPVTTADKLVIRGKEVAIKAVDDSTRRVDGTLIALEIQAAG